MQTLKRFGGSILLALISATLVIGGISLALAENQFSLLPSASEVAPSDPVETLDYLTSLAIPSTSTSLPPITCPQPIDWILITVQPGDTLDILALRYSTTADLLYQANCLTATNLTSGMLLYVPKPPVTQSAPCGPPAGWVLYTIRAGNTLYSLSQAYGVSIAQLQQANCMSSTQTTIKTGQNSGFQTSSQEHHAQLPQKRLPRFQ